MPITIPQQNYLVNLLRPNNIPEGQKLDLNTARMLAANTDEYLNIPNEDPEPTAISKIESVGVGSNEYFSLVSRIPIVVQNDMQQPQNFVQDMNYLISAIDEAKHDLNLDSGRTGSSNSSIEDGSTDSDSDN